MGARASRPETPYRRGTASTPSSVTQGPQGDARNAGLDALGSRIKRRQRRADELQVALLRGGLQLGKVGCGRSGQPPSFCWPRKPIQNAFVERFQGRLRDECLNAH